MLKLIQKSTTLKLGLVFLFTISIIATAVSASFDYLKIPGCSEYSTVICYDSGSDSSRIIIKNLSSAGIYNLFVSRGINNKGKLSDVNKDDVITIDMRDFAQHDYILPVNISDLCLDRDNDGYGSIDSADISQCSRQGIDCNDSKGKWYVNPGAEETCDGLDNDCNGQIDEGCDSDGDHYCSKNKKVYNNSACSKTNVPQGEGGDDYNDDDPEQNPGVEEKCDGIDNNNNNKIDETCDKDGDGYCDDAFYVTNNLVCPRSKVGQVGDDCNDLEDRVSPKVREICNDGIDNDCDSEIDELDCGLALTEDRTKPTVDNNFSALLNNRNVTINYTVRDTGGSGLAKVELWRTEIENNWIDGFQKKQVITGNEVSGSFVDNNLNNGIYWYGIHVIDKNNNRGSENEAKRIEIDIMSSECIHNVDCDDSKECTSNNCINNSCVYANKSAGTVCANGTCDGNGNCTSGDCVANIDCGGDNIESDYAWSWDNGQYCHSDGTIHGNINKYICNNGACLEERGVDHIYDDCREQGCDMSKNICNDRYLIEKYHLLCHGGDVYWAKNGSLGEKKETCSTGCSFSYARAYSSGVAQCNNSSCTPSSDFACSDDGHIHWYDNCGIMSTIKEVCLDGCEQDHDECNGDKGSLMANIFASVSGDKVIVDVMAQNFNGFIDYSVYRKKISDSNYIVHLHDEHVNNHYSISSLQKRFVDEPGDGVFYYVFRVSDGGVNKTSIKTGSVLVNTSCSINTDCGGNYERNEYSWSYVGPSYCYEDGNIHRNIDKYICNNGDCSNEVNLISDFNHCDYGCNSTTNECNSVQQMNDSPSMSQFTARNINNKVVVNYAVADSSGLKKVEIFITTDYRGAPNPYNWKKVNTDDIANLPSNYNSSYIDDNFGFGKFWYGIHIINNNNIESTERSLGWGAILVEISNPGDSECTVDDGCNDNKECTLNNCINDSCVYTNKPEGIACTNGACDSNGNCIANQGSGECLEDSACNDNNPCTEDSCIDVGNSTSRCLNANVINGTENCGSGCNRCWIADNVSSCSPWHADCDGGECKTGTCVNDSCLYNNKLAETVCSTGVCDGNGNCVALTNNPPSMSQFKVEKINNKVVISYTVADDYGLNRVETFITTDSNGSPNEASWEKINTDSIVDSPASYTGSYKDSTSGLGKFWYGVHIVDNEEKESTERTTDWRPVMIEIELVDLIKPTFNDFKANFDAETGRVVIYYYVRDGGGSSLDRIELYKAKSDRLPNFSEFELFYSEDVYKGSFDEGSYTYTESFPGYWWYGAIVYDGNNNKSDFEHIYAPVFVKEEVLPEIVSHSASVVDGKVVLKYIAKDESDSGLESVKIRYSFNGGNWVLERDAGKSFPVSSAIHYYEGEYKYYPAEGPGSYSYDFQSQNYDYKKSNRLPTVVTIVVP